MKQALCKNEAIIDKLLEQLVGYTQLETPASKGRYIVKLPNPPLFKGRIKDSITFNNQVIQVKNKLRGNLDLYSSKDLKIIYITSHVSSNALVLISLYLNIVSRYIYKIVTELYKYLEDLYNNLNKEHNAY